MKRSDKIPVRLRKGPRKNSEVSLRVALGVTAARIIRWRLLTLMRDLCLLFKSSSSIFYWMALPQLEIARHNILNDLLMVKIL